MRSRLADYRLLHPLDPGPASVGSWLAEPPERTGDTGPVVVTELDALDERAWASLLNRLTELARVRSEHLVGQIEAGRAGSDGAGAWASRQRGTARPVAPGDGRQAVLHALAGAALGAAALHEAGYVHGAITPATILVDDGRGLLDLPPDRASLAPPALARVGAVTDLDGMEPDALWGDGPTAASDVYALGAAAHALLSGGRLLHPGLATDRPVTAVQRVLVERPVVDPSLDGDAAVVIGACLAADPADRPASATALAAQLEELAGAGA